MRKSVGEPVESVDLVKRAPVDYSVDPETPEALFYYKVAKPVMFLNDVELITLEAKLLRGSHKLNNFRYSVSLVLNTDLDSVLHTVLRLSTADTRTRGSSTNEESDVRKAHGRFFSAVEELAYELETVIKVSTAILFRDIEWIIERQGFGYRGFKCIEKSTILRSLVREYSHTAMEAEKRVEGAKLAGVVFEPERNVLCPLKQ